MTSKKHINQLARNLVRASLDEEGRLSAKRVEAVLALLRRQPERQRRLLLNAYRLRMRREEAKSKLIIEHAGPLSSEARDTIVSSMSASSGRRLTVETRENPSLIGGVRVRLGDDVYDASITGRLESLAASVN